MTRRRSRWRICDGLGALAQQRPPGVEMAAPHGALRNPVPEIRAAIRPRLNVLTLILGTRRGGGQCSATKAPAAHSLRGSSTRRCQATAACPAPDPTWRLAPHRLRQALNRRQRATHDAGRRASEQPWRQALPEAARPAFGEWVAASISENCDTRLGPDGWFRSWRHQVTIEVPSRARLAGLVMAQGTAWSVDQFRAGPVGFVASW